MIRAGFLANLFFACLISSLSIPFFTSPASAVSIKAEAVYVAGKASYAAAKDSVTRNVAVGIVFEEGDKITTGANGRVDIKFESGGMILIDNNTEFVINSLRYGAGFINTSFTLPTGRIKSSLSKLAEKDATEYRTKAALIGIAGTPEHVLEVNAVGGGKSRTNVYALEGKDGSLRVQGFDPAKTSVMLTAGKGTSVIDGLAPLAPFVLTPAILEGFKHLTALTPHTSAPRAADSAGAESSIGIGEVAIGAVAIGGGIWGVSELSKAVDKIADMSGGACSQGYAPCGGYGVCCQDLYHYCPSNNKCYRSIFDAANCPGSAITCHN